VFDLDYNQIQTRHMTKLVQGAPLQVDLSATLINDKFTIEQHIAGVPH
jgi:hypothetical protein